MPTLIPRTGGARAHSVKVSIKLAALLAAFALGHSAHAQPAAPGTAASTVENSRLDAPLFYQLLIGEIEQSAGESGEAYQVILDAARRTKDEQLFRRATDIAVQARAGDQALAAVKAWRLALPDSLEALRYQVQILVPMNRTPETYEPLQSLVRLTPAAQRPALIIALPRFFARSADHALSAALVEQVLQPYLDASDTRVAAREIGRASCRERVCYAV